MKFKQHVCITDVDEFYKGNYDRCFNIFESESDVESWVNDVAVVEFEIDMPKIEGDAREKAIRLLDEEKKEYLAKIELIEMKKQEYLALENNSKKEEEEFCDYPDCSCPFDAPNDNWCALGLKREVQA